MGVEGVAVHAADQDSGEGREGVEGSGGGELLVGEEVLVRAWPWIREAGGAERKASRARAAQSSGRWQYGVALGQNEPEGDQVPVRRR